jgi:hypothetical protein
MIPAVPANHRLSCDFSLSEGIGTIVLWVLISIFTLGLGLFVMPYYLLKAPINRTKLIGPSGELVGTLHVDVNLGSIIGHAILWFFLTIVTLGLAMIVYQFAVLKRLLNGVTIQG